jgi:hypothetical protein
MDRVEVLLVVPLAPAEDGEEVAIPGIAEAAQKDRKIALGLRAIRERQR